MAIQYVGGAVAASTNGTSVTVNLAALSGGIGTSPQPGDLVIVAISEAGTSDTTPGVFSPSGYVEITKLYSNDTYDTNLTVCYKFMGSTPDSAVVSTASSITSNSCTAVAMVFRGVSIWPFDTTTTTAVGFNTILANPPAITPNTSGAWVVAVGAGASTATTVYTSTGLTNFRSAQAADSYDSVIGMGYVANASGTVDPAVFTGGGTDSGYNSWAAVTIALRPSRLGTSSDTILLTGTAEGTVSSPTASISGESSGTFDLSGSAEARALASGLVAQTIGFDGNATGRVVGQGQATGSIPFGQGATGQALIQATAGTSVQISGAAQARVSVKGTSNQTVAFTGTSTGTNKTSGSGSGVFSVTASTAGQVLNRGQVIEATIPLSGAASSQSGVNGVVGPADLAINGSAEAVVRVTGAASSSVDFAGSAAGSVQINVGSSGSIPVAGSATAKNLLTGQAGGGSGSAWHGNGSQRARLDRSWQVGDRRCC